MFRMIQAAIVLSAITLLLAACGPGGAGSTAPSSAASSEPSPVVSLEPSTEPGASASAGTGAAVTIEVVDDAELGSFLTGADGKTLYILTNDSPDTSTCADSCASSWPPLTVEAGAMVEAGAGVTGALGTITRADGTTQVTYDHQPLYYYVGDAAAGETNGQEMGGVWFVAPVSGASASPSETPGRGNY